MFNIGKNDFVINTTPKDSNIQALVSDITKENLISQKELEYILYKRNSTWWICLLCAIIVFIVACFIVLYMGKYAAAQQKIIEVLAVTSTLLAILLSAFSIFYSYYSTKESSAILVKVSHEVERIETTYKSLEMHQGQLLNILAQNGKQNPMDNMEDQLGNINKDTNNLPEEIQQPNANVQPQAISEIPQSAPQKEVEPTASTQDSGKGQTTPKSKRADRKPLPAAVPAGKPNKAN